MVLNIKDYLGGGLAGKDLRTNELIRALEVRLLDEQGETLGVVPIKEALDRALALDLDLVEIAPQAEPPVCRLLNYGKYKFEQEKKNREARKNQKQTLLKEVRMQPKIASGDLGVKTKHIKSFLEAGDKVKVTVRFKGREMAHPELGARVLDEVLRLLGENIYILEKNPLMEGRMMSMSLASRVKK